MFFDNKGRRGWILYESHLLKKIEENDIAYVVVGPRFHFLGEYLRSSDSFSPVASFRDGKEQIFAVEAQLRPTSHEIFAGTKSIRSRNWNRLLRGRMGLKASEVDMLGYGRTPPGFRKWDWIGN